MMYLKVLKWPESQEVMDDSDWFFIMSGEAEKDPLGSSAYAKILSKEEMIIDYLKGETPSKAENP